MSRLFRHPGSGIWIPVLAILLSCAFLRLDARSQASAPFRVSNLDEQFRGLPPGVGISRDGRWIAYASHNACRGVDLTASPEVPRPLLCVRNLETGNDRVLVDAKDKPGTWFQWAGWSLDGKSILMHWGRPGVRAEAELILVDSESGRQTTLAAGILHPATWSPDGAQVAFLMSEGTASQTGIVAVADVNSGVVRTFGPAPRGVFVWSPDGGQLILPPPLRGDAIQVLALETGERRRLTLPAPPADATLTVDAWTPSGDIAFRHVFPDPGIPPTINDSYRVPATGGQARSVCRQHPDSGCGFSDRDWLAQAPQGQIIRRDLASGGERRVLTHADGRLEASISPDGRLLAFIASREGASALYVEPIDRIDGRPPLRITWLDELLSNEPVRVVWTDAGLLTYFELPETHIYRMPFDAGTGRPSGTATRLTHDFLYNGEPAISPDGRQIAYFYEDGNQSGLRVMNIDGSSDRPFGEPRRMTDPLDHCYRYLAWMSADELSISVPVPGWGVRSLSLTTGASAAVLGGEHAGWIYIPATHSILYSRHEGDWRFRDLRNGSERLIRIPFIDQLMGGPTVSRDGQRIAYSILKGELSGVPPTELRVVRADGSSARPPLKSKGWLTPGAWSPNGKSLIYHEHFNDDERMHARLLNVESGKSLPLPDDIKSVQWSPDGTFIVMTKTTTRKQWRLWRDVTYDAVVSQLSAATKQ